MDLVNLEQFLRKGDRGRRPRRGRRDSGEADRRVVRRARATGLIHGAFGVLMYFVCPAANLKHI